MNCGLYIGCGTDFEPTEHLRNVRKFIFIDSQPLTSHGDLYQAFTPQDKFEFFNKNYMNEFMNASTNAGFQKISIDGIYPHVYKNYNTNQEVYHYYSLCFPIISFKNNPTASQDEILKLIYQIKQVTHLIVRGYSPNYIIFRYIPKPVIFVAYDDTVYGEKINNILPYERKKITVLLQQNQCRNNISEYIYISNDIKETFQNYNDFIYKTKNLEFK
jgi:hypothetical protein